MSNFVRSSVAQKGSRFINIDLVTHITTGETPGGDPRIVFHFSKDEIVSWVYKSQMEFHDELKKVESLITFI